MEANNLAILKGFPFEFLNHEIKLNKYDSWVPFYTLDQQTMAEHLSYLSYLLKDDIYQFGSITGLTLYIGNRGFYYGNFEKYQLFQSWNSLVIYFNKM